MHGFKYRFLNNNIRYNFSTYVDDNESNGTQCNTFMSKSSFVDIMFSSLSAKSIDFSKYVDPFCGHNPDEKYVGSSFQKLTMTPIETDNESVSTVR